MANHQKREEKKKKTPSGLPTMTAATSSSQLACYSADRNWGKSSRPQKINKALEKIPNQRGHFEQRKE